MATFNGQLNSNEIFATLYNMIINITTYADNINGTFSKLVDQNRIEGGLYGDTVVKISTDVLKSAPWGNDAEATNLLQLHRPPQPKTQKITLDQFRQISLTLDDYMTKRAFADQNSFSNFNAVLMSWIRDTKRVYDSTLFNAYVGTAISTVGKQYVELTLPEQDGDTEATNRLQAQAIAEKIANILVELSDVSRDYNDNGFLRSYNLDDIIVVWNSEYLNKIKKYDLPTMFHNEGLIDKFGEDVLPARYFGKINTESGTVSGANLTIRSLIETDYDDVHVFPGDLLPEDAEYEANTTYTVDPDIVCKIMYKRSVPYMSAFSVGTNFFNPKSLTDSHFITWGYNTLQYLENYPMITIEAVQPA